MYLWHGQYQSFRIIFFGLLQHLFRSSVLHYLARLHYHYPIADVVHYRKIVGDKKISELKLRLQVFKQVEYLRLYTNIERRDTFITYQQFRPHGKRAGYTYALPLPAGELVGVAVKRLSRQLYYI